MSPEQQRIAIAQQCEWKLTYTKRCWVPFGSAPNYVELDPLDDLNAMHEAVASQAWDRECMNAFIDNLLCVTMSAPQGDGSYEEMWCLQNATAPQRAKAFLLTLGKWIE